MSKNQELTQLSATEVVAALRRGEVSPVELVDASIERIEAVVSGRLPQQAI